MINRPELVGVHFYIFQRKFPVRVAITISMSYSVYIDIHTITLKV
jgi:hypothetical protein